jgi:hypothetical protein
MLATSRVGESLLAALAEVRHLDTPTSRSA